LDKDYKGKVFTREGKSYLEKYPIFSDWLHILYRVISPLSLLAATTVMIASEWKLKDPALLPQLLNTSIYLMLGVSTVLYIYSLAKMKDNDPEKGNAK